MLFEFEICLCACDRVSVCSCSIIEWLASAPALRGLSGEEELESDLVTFGPPQYLIAKLGFFNQSKSSWRPPKIGVADGGNRHQLGPSHVVEATAMVERHPRGRAAGINMAIG